MEIALVLGLLFLAVVLFASEKFSVDIVTIFLLIVLTSTGILTPEEAFSGFSSDFIIILASIFVVSGALKETGVLDRVGASLIKVSTTDKNMLRVYLMIITGAISAFMNNTTVTALFIGPVVGLCKKLNISPSRMLMPMAFASILGGTCTLIGTSTNVAVSGYLVKAGFESLSIFELAPIGLLIFGCGILYMALIGKYLLPSYDDGDLTESYDIKEYLSEIVISEGSPLIGEKIFSSELTNMDLRILNVIRGHINFLPDHLTVMQEGDMMLVEGKIDNLIKLKERGILIKAETLTDEDLEDENIKLAEVLVTTQSSLIGKTLKEANFRQRFGLVVLAMHRFDQTLRNKIGDIRLKVGDLLLIQGNAERIQVIRNTSEVIVLGEFSPKLGMVNRGYAAVGIFLAAVLAGSLGILPLSIAFLSAALLTVLIKAISTQNAYQAIDWRLLILIGGMSAFGVAMQKTGAADFLAEIIVSTLQPLGITVILSGFVLLTVFLTQPMSNAAAALVVLPIAIQTALQLGVNPRSFGIAIMLAASVSLITPFEPSCILVYSPGKYKFMDFLKIGSGLTMVLMIIIVFLVPVFWPF
jgi:di/tricarboxylate transporter